MPPPPRAGTSTRHRARARAGRSGRAPARARAPAPRSREPSPENPRPEPAPSGRSWGHATASLRVLHADRPTLHAPFTPRGRTLVVREEPMATKLRQDEPRTVETAVETAVEAPPSRRRPEPRGPGHLWKRLALGPALPTAQLTHERLGKPTALAVFASDNLSSSAYATEEILRVAVPAVGVSAFSLLVPITGALLVVLGFLILSYRQTIKAYPSAGGAYIVTRDNFGLLPAQVAGVALLTDYVLTVAVSVAAGSDALASAIAPLAPYKHWIAIGFVVLIAFGNLRGTKESGKLFAAPT